MTAPARRTAARVQTLVLENWLPEQLGNGPHGHWSVRQKKLRVAQGVVVIHGRQRGLEPVVGRARVHINLVFPVKRRRDADGLHSRVKGVLDGLVRGGWLVDDSIDHIDLVVTAEVRAGEMATEITLEAVE